MCCNINKGFFSFLIFASLLCFFLTDENTVWATQQTQTQQTQTVPTCTSIVDLPKFHWLIRLSTDKNMIDGIFGSTDPEQEIKALSENLTEDDKTHLRSFIKLSKERNHGPLFRALNDSFADICKQKPCPPVRLADYESWCWLVLAFRDSEFREIHVQDPQNILQILGNTLCQNDVWGPCP